MNHKIWTLALLTCVAGCSKMIKEEPYLTASTSKELSPAGDNDMPNTSNNLSIPNVNQSNQGVPNDRPPEMAFARKRSQQEDIVISELNGKPTVEIYNDTSPWELMIINFGSHWRIENEDPENCQVTLRYNDPIGKEVSEQGFFKRIFTAQSKYVDLSGIYQLKCHIENNRNLITFQTEAGQNPSSHVVDDLFAHIFQKATE